MTFSDGLQSAAVSMVVAGNEGVGKSQVVDSFSIVVSPKRAHLVWLLFDERIADMQS